MESQRRDGVPRDMATLSPQKRHTLDVLVILKHDKQNTKPLPFTYQACDPLEVTLLTLLLYYY